MSTEAYPFFEQLQKQLLMYIAHYGFVSYDDLIRRVYMLIQGLGKEDLQFYKNRYSSKTNLAYTFITPLVALGILEPTFLFSQETANYRYGIKLGTLSFIMEGEEEGFMIEPFVNQFFHQEPKRESMPVIPKNAGLQILHSCPKAIDILHTFQKEQTVIIDTFWNQTTKSWVTTKPQPPFIGRNSKQTYAGNYIRLEESSPLLHIDNHKKNYDAFNIARGYLNATHGKAFYSYHSKSKQLSLVDNKTANSQTIVIARALLLFNPSQLLNRENYCHLMTHYQDITTEAVKELQRIFGANYISIQED